MNELRPSDRAHLVQFYEGDAFLLDEVARFVGSGLGAGDAVVIVATPEHRAGIARELAAHAVDVARARRDRRYMDLDATETLARFMVNGMPDRARFRAVVGGVVAA